MSDRYDSLDKIFQLKERGVLSDDEYQQERARILRAPIRERLEDRFKGVPQRVRTDVVPTAMIIVKVVSLSIFAILVVGTIVAFITG